MRAPTHTSEPTTSIIAFPGISAERRVRRRRSTSTLDPEWRTWVDRWGTHDEQLLVARASDQAARLNEAARAALKAAGRLGGPLFRVGSIYVNAGDRIVVGPQGLTASPGSGPRLPPGLPGDVRFVDPSGRWILLDFPAAGPVTLRRPELFTADLRYGYAVVFPEEPSARRRKHRLRLLHPARLGPSHDGGR